MESPGGKDTGATSQAAAKQPDATTVADLTDEGEDNAAAQVSAKPLEVEAARRLTEKIKVHAEATYRQLTQLKALIDEAERGQAHVALGYPGWTAYLKDVLGELHLQPRP